MNDLTALNAPPALEAIWRDTRALGFNMASEPLTCTLLRTLAAMKPAARLLELGSGTGLSTAWLLNGMDGASRLTTIDNDPALLSVLRRHLGSDPRLQVHCTDADEFLQSLHGPQFDLIFADTWAGKFRCLDKALELLNPAGCYVIDDLLVQPNWPEGHSEKVINLLNKLEQRHDVIITKMSWASGLLLAIKR